MSRRCPAHSLGRCDARSRVTQQARVGWSWCQRASWIHQRVGHGLRRRASPTPESSAGSAACRRCHTLGREPRAARQCTAAKHASAAPRSSAGGRIRRSRGTASASRLRDELAVPVLPSPGCRRGLGSARAHQTGLPVTQKGGGGGMDGAVCPRPGCRRGLGGACAHQTGLPVTQKGGGGDQD